MTIQLKDRFKKPLILPIVLSVLSVGLYLVFDALRQPGGDKPAPSPAHMDASEGIFQFSSPEQEYAVYMLLQLHREWRQELLA